MSDCARFVVMIGALPGELSADDGAAFADHVAGCPPCQARVADEAALAGLVAESLAAEAARRDFAGFADGVLGRIPAGAWTPARSGATAAPVRPSVEAGPLSRLRAWARHHRAAAVAGMLAPALAAAALFVYLSGGSGDPAMELSAEGRNEMVLQTSDGPVVLFGDADGT